MNCSPAAVSVVVLVAALFALTSAQDSVPRRSMGHMVMATVQMEPITPTETMAPINHQVIIPLTYQEVRYDTGLFRALFAPSPEISLQGLNYLSVIYSAQTCVGPLLEAALTALKTAPSILTD